LKPPLPFVPRSMSPPSTCPVSDQDVCLQPDSLSTRSRPRRTTPVGAPVAAALGPGSSNQHRGRRVFFHVNFIPSSLLIPRRSDNFVACGMIHPISERPTHVDCSN
jgi:hypothetical protein